MKQAVLNKRDLIPVAVGKQKEKTFPISWWQTLLDNVSLLI